MKCEHCNEKYSIFDIVNPGSNGQLYCKNCKKTVVIIDNSDFFEFLSFLMYCALLFIMGLIFGISDVLLGFLLYFVHYFFFKIIIFKIHFIKKSKHH